jgi:hypothetical protein
MRWENKRSTRCPPIVLRQLMFSLGTQAQRPVQRLPPLLQFPGILMLAAWTRVQVLRMQGLLKRWL